MCVCAADCGGSNVTRLYVHVHTGYFCRAAGYAKSGKERISSSNRSSLGRPVVSCKYQLQTQHKRASQNTHIHCTVHSMRSACCLFLTVQPRNWSVAGVCEPCFGRERRAGVDPGAHWVPCDSGCGRRW